MAGRFVFHKFSSGVSRSTSLLGHHASAFAARAGAPKSSIIVSPPSQDCGTRNISNALHGTALRPGMAFTNNHGIHVYAARSPSSRPAAAEAIGPTTRMPSSIMNRTAPTFVDSVTGSKRGLSSTASNNHQPSEKAKSVARQGKAKYNHSDVHDFTPSVILNSLATLAMWLSLITLAKG